jgi:predicted CoA-binding protein
MTARNRKIGGWENPSAEEIAKMIRGAQTIAIVGLSSNSSRPAYRVAEYLQKNGFTIIPVNPNESEVLGERAYPDLASIDKHIDIVDVFRRPEDTPQIVGQAIDAGAGYVWLQEGIVSQEAYDLAIQHGVPIVMDRCLKKEHGRLKI